VRLRHQPPRDGLSRAAAFACPSTADKEREDERVEPLLCTASRGRLSSAAALTCASNDARSTDGACTGVTAMGDCARLSSAAAFACPSSEIRGTDEDSGSPNAVATVDANSSTLSVVRLIAFMITPLGTCDPKIRDTTNLGWCARGALSKSYSDGTPADGARLIGHVTAQLTR
jgi:hypothetical protein